MVNRNIKSVLVAVAFLATIILTSPEAGCEDITGGYAGAFLRIGCGARALGMGNAFCAVSDDATAVFWNPAGLGLINTIQITGTYANLRFDRAYNSIMVAGHLGKFGTIAGGWIGYSIKDIPGMNTPGSSPNYFDDSENAFILSYGRNIYSLFYGGMNVKYLSHTLENASASGYGFDLGIMARLKDYASFGAVVQDIGSYFKWDTRSERKEDVPAIYRVGVALTYPGIPLILSADYEKQRKINPGKKRVGLETSFYNLLCLRAGYDNSVLTAGASLSPRDERYRFDYAYRKDFLGDKPVHFFSLSIALAKK
jgi:hypothetical protein